MPEVAEDFHPKGGTANFLPHSFHATSIASMLRSQNQLGARCPRAPQVPLPMTYANSGFRVAANLTALI